jgi:glycosyltransferase involved in cell wall biosynthesis
MSEEQTVETNEIAYEDRPIQEVESLRETITKSNFGGYAYTAEPAPGADVHGIWHCFHTDSRAGYAAHAVAASWMIREEMKAPLMLIPHRVKDIDIDNFPADRDEMLLRWLSKSPVGFPEMLLVSLPPETQMFGLGKATVYYSAYEATRVSQWTADTVNSKGMTAIWCVSDFVKRAFEAGGCNPSKLDVVRPMLCGGPWAMPEQMVPVERDEFVFGTMGTWHERKGFPHLIRAYFSQFRRDENVVLNIRTSLFGKNKTITEFTDGVVKEIAEIAEEFGDDDYPRSKKMPRVRLQTGTDLSDQEVIDWLASLDGYVQPSFGEGLGIPAIWAKAVGCPLVCTDFGALGDFAVELERETDSGTIDAIVKHRLVPVPQGQLVVSPMFHKKSEWGDYDPKDFGAAMRTVFERGRKKDIHGAVATRRLFGAEATVPVMAEAIKRRTGVSEWGTP